jgi:hypothetical protein
MRVGRKFVLLVIFGLLCAGSTALATDVVILRNGFSIRHERRSVLGADTRLYFTDDGTSFVDVPTAEIDHIEENVEPDPTPIPPPGPPSVAPAVTAVRPSTQPGVGGQAAPPVARVPNSISVQDAVHDASGRYRLDPDLVNSVIRAESGFNPHAVSTKGARGLMQLMPQTASKLGVPNAFDPQANVDGGTRYLRELLERYNFDLIKALAAYNAGPQRVEQYGGVPPYRETRAYVTRIVKDFNKKKLAQQKAAGTAQKASQAKPARASQSARTTASTEPSPSR